MAPKYDAYDEIADGRDGPWPAACDAPTEQLPRIQPADPDAPGGQLFHLPPRRVPDNRIGLVPPAPPPAVKGRRRPPADGWRRIVHTVTGGLLNLGDSQEHRRRRDLVHTAAAPIFGDCRIAVLSLKGGVGKTTTTVALGATLASARNDRIIAVDANPDFGTMAQRSAETSRSAVRDVLADGGISRYSDLHAHTSRGASGLEMLASETDPQASEALTASDYTSLVGRLHRFYNIILTDCGTGLVHPVMRGVLAEATAVVLVTSPAADGVRSTAATLDWLAHNGHLRLAATATVVISAARPGTRYRDVAATARFFQQRVSSVHFVPFDQHLAEGSEIALERMKSRTREAFLTLAAGLVESVRFPRW